MAGPEATSKAIAVKTEANIGKRSYHNEYRSPERVSQKVFS